MWLWRNDLGPLKVSAYKDGLQTVHGKVQHFCKIFFGWGGVCKKKFLYLKRMGDYSAS